MASVLRRFFVMHASSESFDVARIAKGIKESVIKLSLATSWRACQLPRPFSRKNPAMSYAVIKTGGKQYRVAKGDTVSVEKLDGEVGSAVTFNEVLLVGAGAGIKVGGEIKGASVSGEIVDQLKGPKVLAYRYKRRKGYQRSVGHRQRVTKVKVTGING
jgi:large subunit ribosomal protein L21